jgi:hypothetical protein
MLFQKEEKIWQLALRDETKVRKMDNMPETEMGESTHVDPYRQLCMSF